MNTRPEASENLRVHLARWPWDSMGSHGHVLPWKVLQIGQHRPDTKSESKASRCFTKVLTAPGDVGSRAIRSQSDVS